MPLRSLFVVSSIAVATVLAPGAPAKVDAAAAPSCTSSLRTLASAGATSGIKVFHDFIEDTPGPDICGDNAVTNDNEGTITFGLHIHNRTSFSPTDRYGVFLDTDNNPATGPGGGDYRVRVTVDSVELGKWDGTGAFVVQSTLPPARWERGYGPVWQIKAADLGITQSFGFVFYASDGTNSDLAPNRGAWSYQLAPLELQIRSLTLDRAKAGRSFSARMAVLRSDLDAPLTEGAIACSARLGAKQLTGTGRFAGVRAVCTWRLAKSARRKRLSGTVAVTFQNVEAKRSFATVVR